METTASAPTLPPPPTAHPAHPAPPADARRIAEQLTAELQVTFAAQGFWLETKGTELGGRTYVDVSELREETATRLIDALRGWLV